MNSARLWIVLLALTSFCAGTAAGVLAGVRLAPEDSSGGAFPDYSRQLTRRYGLDEDSQRRLRAILELYRRDLEDLKSRSVAAAEPELIRLGEACRQRIRDYVLPEDEKSAFDEADGLQGGSESLSY
jgi:hypothetical protein